MKSVLVTERLVLRRFTDGDVDLLVELDSDPSVMQFITGGAFFYAAWASGAGC